MDNAKRRQLTLHLADAERHVLECERLVARQRTSIEERRRQGHDVALATDLLAHSWRRRSDSTSPIVIGCAVSWRAKSSRLRAAAAASRQTRDLGISDPAGVRLALTVSTLGQREDGPMSNTKGGEETRRRKEQKPPVDRQERASPGSGEDEEPGAADLQPNEVGDDTAR